MRIAEHHAVPLILRRRFWMPGDEVLALVVLVIYDLTAHGIAVLMDIGRTHKNRYLQPAILEIFFIHYLFDDHHFSIRRADDKVISPGQLAVRHPEKRNEK